MTKIRVRPRKDGGFEAHIFDFPFWNRIEQYISSSGGYFRTRFDTREEALRAAKEALDARRQVKESRARLKARARQERTTYHNY